MAIMASCIIANYNTILSGHQFKVKDPKKFRELCQDILNWIGLVSCWIDGYSVRVAEGNATLIYKGPSPAAGARLNVSLAEALRNPESYEEEDGSNPILELRNLIKEYILEPWTVEEIGWEGWEKCRYVTHDSAHCSYTIENCF